MKKILRLLKILAFVLLGPFIVYFTFAMVTSNIIVNQEQPKGRNNSIFLNNSSIHLDLIFPAEYLEKEYLTQLNVDSSIQFLAFGWGEEKFYLETPEWSDLTVSNAANALLWNSSSLMHVNQIQTKNNSWHEIHLNDEQLHELKASIQSQFAQRDAKLIPIPDFSYFGTDQFYKAKGDYSCINTCNSWINDCLKSANLPSCYWTPFGSSITSIYMSDD